MAEHGDMSNLDDRIRSLDPFAGASYERADVDSMVERVTSAGPPRRHRRPLAVLVGPLTAVTVAGLAIGGALASSGTPAQVAAPLVLGHAATPARAIGGDVYATNSRLSHLDLGVNGFGVSSSYAPAASPTTTSGYAVLYELGSPLPTARPTLDAYAAIPPAHPTATLAAAAAHLGVRGQFKQLAATAWTLATVQNLQVASIAALGRRSAPDLFEFRYLRGDLARPTSACAAGARSGAPIDTRRVAMTVGLSGLLDAAGLHYELAAPSLRTHWSSSPASRCSGTVIVTRGILVHGIATDLSVQAAFDPAGRLVAASFPVFRIGRAAAYPLVSAANAAGTLVESNHAALATTQGDHRTAGYGAPRGFVIVELRSSSVALSAFATTSGALWLVPVYALGGASYTVNSMVPTPWRGDVVAASTPLVRIRGTKTNQARVFGPFSP